MKPIPKTMQANIIDLVCEFFGVTPEELDNKRMNTLSSYRRRICWYLLKKNTAMSYEDISCEFNTKHTTIVYGYKGIEDLLTYDRRTIDDIKDLQKIIDNFNIQKVEKLLQKEWPTQSINTTR